MTAPKPRPIPVPLRIELDPKFHRLADSAGQDLLAHSVGGYAQELADDLGLSAKVRTSVSIAAGEPSGRLPYRVSVNEDRKSTRLNSSHLGISYAVFCL